jgi:hypothetical protein
MESTICSDQKLAGVAGIGFAATNAVILGLAGNAPSYDDSAAEFREFFVDSGLDVHLTTWLAALMSVFFFLPFSTGLRNVLAAAEGPQEPLWSRLSYTGAVIAATLTVAGSTFWEVLSQGTAEQLSDDTLVVLARFDAVFLIGVLPWAVALLLAASSVVIVRTGVLARWIGWFGGASALLLLVGTLWLFAEDGDGAIAGAGYLGLVMSAVWVLVVGISMLRASSMPRPTNTSRPPPTTTL